MRVIRFLVALCCLAAGAVLGALNPGIVPIDLGVTVVGLPLGVALIAALLAGILIGGLALTLSVVLPLRRALHASRQPRAAAAVVSAPGDIAPVDIAPVDIRTHDLQRNV